MKLIFILLSLFLLCNCVNQRQNNIADNTATDTTQLVHNPASYPEDQLEAFLDSIGHLSPSLWTQRIAFTADSVFKHHQQLNKTISPESFSKLKQVVLENDLIDRVLDVKTAKSIFGNIDQVDSTFIAEDRIPFTFISFEKNKEDFHEYAIYLGYPISGWSCVLYIFKSNKIIAKHNIYHRYGLELNHYKDTNNKTVIYYKENFGSGTGIWQFNYYFYKYSEDKLIPVLNVLENGNLNGWGSMRNYWLKASVINTRPLTLKMKYYQELIDTAGNSTRIIDDSTFVQYTWDEATGILVGDYEESKINKSKILSFYIMGDDLQFINAYHSELKKSLQDTEKRTIVLSYLNKIKTYVDSKKNKKDGR